jgi:hypothetical protein
VPAFSFLLRGASTHLAAPVVDLEAVSSDPGEQGERRRGGLEVDRGPGADSDAARSATKTMKTMKTTTGSDDDDDAMLRRHAGRSGDAPSGSRDPRRCRAGDLPRQRRRRGAAEHHRREKRY